MLLAAVAARAAYTYYYTDTFSSINTSNWYVNGTISGGSNGLAGSGGSVISKLAVPGPSSTSYEVKSTYNLTTSGGYYETYLRATSNADINGSVTGTFYSVELANPTFTNGVCTAGMNIYKSISGSPTSLANLSSVPCNNQMIERVVIHNSTIIVYINNYLVTNVTDTAITSGQPGVGALSVPSGNGIAQVQLGQLGTC